MPAQPPMLPPDGEPWPPEPPAAVDDADHDPPVATVVAHAPGPAPIDAPPEDWRTFTSPDVPPGYRGSSTAPMATIGREPWSLTALITAFVGVIPLLWPVPLLSILAVAFALVGLNNFQLDARWNNRWMAVIALAVGLATLVAVALLAAFNQLDLGI